MTETKSERVRRFVQLQDSLPLACPRANFLKNPINIGDIDGG